MDVLEDIECALKDTNRLLERVFNKMATAEQTQAVVDAAARIEQGVAAEEVQLREIVKLLQEAQGNQHDPLLDSAITALNGAADRIAGFSETVVTDPPVPE